MAILTKNCANHPERLGKALCMSCRKTVCQECSTQWDGINYCVSCLQNKRLSENSKSSLFKWAAMMLAIVVLLYVGSLVMVWSCVLLVKMYG